MLPIGWLGMMVLDGMLGTRILFDSLGGLVAVFRVEEMSMARGGLRCCFRGRGLMGL